MKDRELVELAAKAADLDLAWCEFWGCMAKNLGVLDGFDSGTCWNPLHGDGDALRLAVKLRFSVTVFEDAIGVGFKYEDVSRYLEFDIEGDVFRATRRAITSAAAQLQLEKEKK